MRHGDKHGVNKPAVKHFIAVGKFRCIFVFLYLFKLVGIYVTDRRNLHRMAAVIHLSLIRPLLKRPSDNASLIAYNEYTKIAFYEQEIAESAPENTAESMIFCFNQHIFESITVPDLAEHFYLSPSQFNRIFKKSTGAAPWEYITKKRLTAAKEKTHWNFGTSLDI